MSTSPPEQLLTGSYATSDLATIHDLGLHPDLPRGAIAPLHYRAVMGRNQLSAALLPAHLLLRKPACAGTVRAFLDYQTKIYVFLLGISAGITLSAFRQSSRHPELVERVMTSLARSGTITHASA